MKVKGFGKIVDGVMTFADDYLVKDNGGIIIHPSNEQYKEAGWLPNEYTVATPEDGYHVSSWEWKTDGQKNFKAYTYSVDEKVARQISKQKLYGILKTMGYWDKVVDWMNSNEINGVNVYTAFMLASPAEMYEDNPIFEQMFEKIKSELGVSDVTGETILAASVEE